MLTEFVGVAILEVDGREIEVTGLDVTDQTGRRAARTMNRTGRITGFARTLGQYDLRVTALVPATGTPVDWANIQGAKLSITPLAGGRRTSYSDCFATQVGESYNVDNEARIDLQLTAATKIVE